MSAPDRQLTSPSDLLRTWATKAPHEPATHHRAAGGGWVPTTWSALWNQVERLASTFVALGLRPGDRLAIVGRTSREWQLAEHAAWLAGATVVGIDPSASSEQIGWILEHASVSGLVAQSANTLATVPESSRLRLKWSGVWQELLALPSSGPLPVSTSRPEDIAILIYTSGTTGTPKGIEYTHGQLMTACRAMLEEFPDLQQPNRLVCWLPMAALFQRMINLVALVSRSATYFVEDPREIMACVAEVRPTVFFSVPRFYEKLHDGIRNQVSTLTGFRARLVAAALAAGSARAALVRSGRRPGWWLALRCAVLDRLVLARMRRVMGGEMKWMITGSAAAPVWLLEFFQGLGLLLLEAYGITENPVPIAANRPHRYRFGSVGQPFAMNELRLSAEGEVLVKGPALFRGYRGDTNAADLFTADGFYKTGDIGRLDEDGFLFLTGRLTELIKTSTGRRISPASVEGAYRRSRYLDQVVIIGNNRPFLTALITVNVPVLQGALALAGPVPPEEQWPVSDAVLNLLQAELASAGQTLSRHEQIGAFRMLPEPISVEGGLMTPTLKLRRDRIETRYAALIHSMYAGAQDPAVRRLGS